MLLDDEGEEYERVAAEFHRTMPPVNAFIMRIERIQNKVLWKNYFHKSRLMYEFGDGVLNEKLLFHGSGQNDPELIYKGDASFDMRYSNKGMWGLGNYFAANASYSNGLAYTRKLNSAAMQCRQMLAAWVLTGNSYSSPPNSALKQPPSLPRKDQLAPGEVQRSYDSVNGSTGGSTVYITYDNTLAYPAYLITYECEQ